MVAIIRSIIKSYYTYKVKKRAKTVGTGLRVNHKSSVTKNTVLGNNVNFNGMKIGGSGQVIIGDNFHSGMDCLMISEIHNYDSGKAIPYDDSFVSKDILIEDNVWLGERVIVLGGVTIGEGAIIQAGSVVVNDIPPLAIAGGHPARVFKQRNEEHYFRLKKQKSFF